MYLTLPEEMSYFCCFLPVIWTTVFILQTAGRDLHPDEVELRSIWIALVYLTLENANWPQKVKRAHEISAPFMVRMFVFLGLVGSEIVSFWHGRWSRARDHGCMSPKDAST